MNRLARRLALLAITAYSYPLVAETASSASPHLEFRYRLEAVDQKGLPEDALASTLKTRFGYRTPRWHNTTLFFEVDNITYLGSEAFNNTRNGSTRYPVVADPSGTDINQFYLESHTNDWSARLGRQRILHDDQRFIGGVGWRQNEQTYDSFVLSYQPGGKLEASWSLINRISRIFGPNDGVPAADLDSDANLFRVQYDTGTKGELTGYSYLLDLEDAPQLSSRTTGIRYQHQFKLGEFLLPFTAEFARQTDYADRTADLSVNYMAIDLALKTRLATFKIGNERLEGSANGGFETPLATLHKFQGWADKFLSTPASGIDDRYIGAAGKTGAYQWQLVYHDFDAERGSTDYGSELDFSLGYRFNDKVAALAKFARYDADSFSTDTTKVWLMLNVSI